jgi:hypothetical protein
MRASVPVWRHEPPQKSARAAAPDSGIALHSLVPEARARGREQPAQAQATRTLPEQQVLRLRHSDAPALRHGAASPVERWCLAQRSARSAAKAQLAESPMRRLTPERSVLQTRRPARAALLQAPGTGSRIDAAGLKPEASRLPDVH